MSLQSRQVLGLMLIVENFKKTKFSMYGTILVSEQMKTRHHEEGERETLLAMLVKREGPSQVC